MPSLAPRSDLARHALLLALGEAGNFPGAVKTIAEWFPKKERALATGIFNSGSDIGAIAAPLLVPFIAIRLGWEWTFIITGSIGFVWLIFWLTTLSPAGRASAPVGRGTGLHKE